MVKDTDLAWLAGIIDAEGAVGLVRKKYVDKFHYEPRISISNTDEDTILFIQELLTTYNLKYNINWYTYQNRPNARPRGTVVVYGGKRCKMWLDLFIPHLRIKQIRAIHLQEWCSLTNSNPRSRGRTYGQREKEILYLFGISSSIEIRRKYASSTYVLNTLPLVDYPPRTREMDIAWIAGLFDGDGSIFYYKRGGTTIPCCALSNTHMPSLPYIINILNTHSISYYLYKVTPKNPLWSQEWRVQWYGTRHVEPWLNLLFPYLYTRQPCAESMLKYISQE